MLDPRLALLAAVLSVSPASAQVRQDLPRAVYADPAPDPVHPPTLTDLRIPSHGSAINAVIYSPTGAGPHPVLILFHGFPGNEQNLDLARAAQRQGWAVLTQHYRGSWGSQGDFSFTHVLEDAQAALDWARDPQTVAQFRLNPKRVVLAGHSWAASRPRRPHRPIPTSPGCS
jgi:acetyl esterase/lipase